MLTLIIGLHLISPMENLPAAPIKLSFASTHIAVITGEWKEGRKAAWDDVKKKALEKAMNAYKITDSSIATKGKLRKVTITIQWTD